MKGLCGSLAVDGSTMGWMDASCFGRHYRQSEKIERHYRQSERNDMSESVGRSGGGGRQRGISGCGRSGSTAGVQEFRLAPPAVGEAAARPNRRTRLGSWRSPGELTTGRHLGLRMAGLRRGLDGSFGWRRRQWEVQRRDRIDGHDGWRRMRLRLVGDLG